MANILVTGSDGYIGSGLVKKLLADGHQVSCVDKKIFYNLESGGLSGILRPCDDIKDITVEHLKPISHVIHLAAISNDPAAELDARLTWETNVLYTLFLMDNAAKARVPQFTFASSGSVYGLKDEDRVTEELELMPITDYNKSKMCAERILLSYRDQIGLTIIRPATVCGVSERQRLDVVVNILTSQALKNKVIKLFGGDQVRPHIHMSDMHGLYLEIIKNPAAYQGVFNAGFENLTNKELAQLIADSTGAAIEKTTSSDNRSYRLCSDKLLAAGFKPQHSVREAVNDITQSFKQGTLQDGPQTQSVQWLKQYYGK
jgi:nucleoside-diphosphate-sugar epimerase